MASRFAYASGPDGTSGRATQKIFDTTLGAHSPFGGANALQGAVAVMIAMAFGAVEACSASDLALTVTLGAVAPEASVDVGEENVCTGRRGFRLRVAGQAVQRPMGSVTEQRVFEPDLRNLRRHDPLRHNLASPPLINMTFTTRLLAEEH